MKVATRIVVGILVFLLAIGGVVGYVWYRMSRFAAEIGPTLSQIHGVMRDAAPGSIVLWEKDTLATVDRLAGMQLPSEVGNSVIVFEGAPLASGDRWPPDSAFIGLVAHYGSWFRPIVVRLVPATSAAGKKPFGQLRIRGMTATYRLVADSAIHAKNER